MRDRAYMDVLQRPRNRTHPAIPRNPLWLLLRLQLQPPRVPGATRPIPSRCYAVATDNHGGGMGAIVLLPLCVDDAALDRWPRWMHGARDRGLVGR